MKTSPRQRVAIIGGGWAGLATAVELSAAGISVSVFEAAKQLGGRARSVFTREHLLDNGQHILIGAYRETLRLMRRVGVRPEEVLRRLPLDLRSPRAGFAFRLPRLPAPFHLAAGLLRAEGVMPGEKIAAARFILHLQARNYCLDEDQSVAQLLDHQRQGGMLRRCLWESLCLAALNTAPEKASAQHFANVLRDSLGGPRSATDLMLPATDLSRLFPDAAARFIKAHGGSIHLSARIDSLSEENRLGEERFDHVVLAVAPQHAGALLAGLPPMAETAKTLGDYDYEPIATAYLAYPREVTLPHPMLGLETSQNSIGQWVFDRGELCATPGLMSFVLSARGAWETLSNGELAACLHRELEQTLGQKLPETRWHQVIREQRATFSCRPALPRPSMKTRHPGLWLAGDYVCADYPATLEGAVRSGTAVSGAILHSKGL